MPAQANPPKILLAYSSVLALDLALAFAFVPGLRGFRLEPAAAGLGK